MERTCARCGQTKPLTHFNKQQPNRYRDDCKPCEKRAARATEQIRAYYRSHVTIAALAREAGVSAVLSGRVRASPKIEKAARDMGIAT